MNARLGLDRLAQDQVCLREGARAGGGYQGSTMHGKTKTDNVVVAVNVGELASNVLGSIGASIVDDDDFPRERARSVRGD